MRRSPILALLALGAACLLLLAFQCSSPEFTGAKIAVNQKNYKEAIRLLEIEVQKNPGNEEAWYLLGGLKADQYDYAGMNTAFDAAIKISQKHAQEIKKLRYNRWGVHVNLGVGYLERASQDSAQYFDLSINEFHRAMAAWPDTALTFRYLGYAYNNKGDYDSALISFNAAWEQGKDVESMRRAGRIYLQRGANFENEFNDKFADSLRLMKNFAEIVKGVYKNDVLGKIGAADSTKTIGGKKSKKEEWIYSKYHLMLDFDGDKVASKIFRVPYSPHLDSTLIDTAQICFLKAVDAFERVRDASAADTVKDTETLNLLLQAYVKANKIKEAIVAFKDAVARDPQNKQNRYILGVLYRTSGDYTASIEQFKESIKIDPGFNDGLFDLGATYYNWGVEILKAAQDKGEDTEDYKAKFKEALPYLEKVSETKKDDPNVWETLGTIYARLGQSDKAMESLNMADFLRKYPVIKVGAAESDVSVILGDPNEKKDVEYQGAKSTEWTYKSIGASLYFSDGKLKGWVRTSK
ncbi:MAG TPA: tetratricopeptide repeat protein [Bacteroidota bacterium]|nr:tetratricopeptide repeat protein [Bacteroidota bacterium]